MELAEHRNVGHLPLIVYGGKKTLVDQVKMKIQPERVKRFMLREEE
jgi:hypothetical protein